MSRNQGFTLLELLIVIAALGVLLIAAGNLTGDRFAVNQASRGLAASINRARLEALRLNLPVGLRLDTASETYFIFKDCGGKSDDACEPNYAYDATESASKLTGSSVNFASGTFAVVTFGSTTAQTYIFDARGMLRTPTTSSTIVLRNTSNSYQRQITISTQGRATQ